MTNYKKHEVLRQLSQSAYRGKNVPKGWEEGTPLYDLYIDQWLDKNPMPTKKEVDKRVRIGELIYVEEYTRSDGKKFRGIIEHIQKNNM